MDRISLENNIYRELGELYSRMMKNEIAKDYLEKAVKMFPDDYKAESTLALIYMRMGRTDLSKEIFNKLLAKKEIKNNKFVYNQILNRYEILMKKEYLESNPREMRVTITNKCNIGCRYCDIWKVPDWKLSDERMKEIMNYFPYLENMYWLGGETFLYKGFEEILEEGSKYDTLNQTILTNGLLLNEKILEKISKANISLIIAIDAGKKETYEYLRRGSSWEKLCKNLELIKEVGQKTNKTIKTTFNAVISKSNYKEMFEMVEMAHKYDFNEIRFMQILGNSDENIFLNRDMDALNYIRETIPYLEQKVKDYNMKIEQRIFSKNKMNYKDINVNFVKNNKYNLLKTDRKIMECVTPWTQIVIDSKGPMRPCVNCNDWLGDSSKQTIKEFWNSDSMQFYRKKFGEMYSCVSNDVLCGTTTAPSTSLLC